MRHSLSTVQILPICFRWVTTDPAPACRSTDRLVEAGGFLFSAAGERTISFVMLDAVAVLIVTVRFVRDLVAALGLDNTGDSSRNAVPDCHRGRFSRRLSTTTRD